MIPIKRGTAQKLGLRKPPFAAYRQRHALGMTWREDDTWLIEWAQQQLGVTFAPWQRWTLENYTANRL